MIWLNGFGGRNITNLSSFFLSKSETHCLPQRFDLLATNVHNLSKLNSGWVDLEIPQTMWKLPTTKILSGFSSKMLWRHVYIYIHIIYPIKLFLWNINIWIFCIFLCSYFSFTLLLIPYYFCNNLLQIEILQIIIAFIFFGTKSMVEWETNSYSIYIG